MKIKPISIFALIATTITAIETAQAHTSFVNTPQQPPVANSYYFATLNLGHGCSDPVSGAHLDTKVLTVDIPTGITSIRPMDASWGSASVVKDSAGNITQLIWTRNMAPQSEDSHLYRASFQVKLPNSPLSALQFPSHQTCDANGVEITSDWIDAQAPTLRLQQSRMAGWNRYTAQVAIDQATLAAFFNDALIVWSGNAAYSANPVTDQLISNALTVIPAGAEYWVKY